MSELIEVSAVKIGDTISFKTINSYDTVERRAKVVGYCTYAMAKQLSDLLPYYQNVKKSNPNVVDIENAYFLVMECYENSDNSATNRRVFATDWIDPSTLKLIDIGQHIDFRVFDITDHDVTKILDVLSDMGYSACTVING